MGTIATLNIPAIDAELSAMVPPGGLSGLARHGLRGELVFPVPSVLRENPRLLGYYRLLLGYSQKEFYTSTTGAGRFKAMEMRGEILAAVDPDIPTFCSAMIRQACLLLEGIGSSQVSKDFLDDLTLLTLGPQLRGGANVAIGNAAIVRVFDAIKEIVSDALTSTTPSKMVIRNAAGRTVYIEFAADPDIILREEMPTGALRNIIAIEVKGGKDYSNIHNRIGEAEKSHQKARQAGYVECWTIVNVDRVDMNMARRESPTTNRFYLMSHLANLDSPEFKDFKDRIINLTGISSAGASRPRGRAARKR